MWSYDDIGRSISTVSITEDGLLFVAEYAGKIHCLDAETGQPYWVHDAQAHIWGSTLVADGKVYIGTEDGSFFLRSKQGEEASQSDGSRRAGLCDPGGGQRCPVCANANAPVCDYEGNDTLDIWRPLCQGPVEDRRLAQPHGARDSITRLVGLQRSFAEYSSAFSVDLQRASFLNISQ